MSELFYKSYSQNAVASVTDETFRRVSIHVYKIYLPLLFSAIMGTAGAVLSTFFPLRASNADFHFILTIWFLCTMNKHKQFRMFLTFLASSLFFGATITSLMTSFFPSLNERAIIIFFLGLDLLFCFHLFALRTHNIKLIYQINYFTLPLFILSLLISILVVSHWVFPHVLLYVIPSLVSIPSIWHLGLWFFEDKIWTPRKWIPIHFCLLGVLSSFSGYYVLQLVGIYLFMLCILMNLKLHTFDSIYAADHSVDHAALPVSLNLTFYTEFVARSSYMFIYSGQTLYQYLWDSSHMVLRQKWEACCTVCANAWDYFQRFLWNFIDYIMIIFKIVWNSVGFYFIQFRDHIIGSVFISIAFCCFIVYIFLFLAGRL